MKFKATIHIMPLDEILDPQGKATQVGLHNLELDTLHDVRIGKRIELNVDADNEGSAREMLQKACSKLLANTVIEKFEFELQQV